MRELLAVLGIVCIAGCSVPDTSDLAPTGPNTPGPDGYVLAPDPRIMPSKPQTVIGNARNYDLSTLIDLAETNNPKTRSAWQQAKAAATAVGLVEATYTPRLSAEILAGYQRSQSAALQDPLGILPSGTVTAGAGVGAAVLSVQWLLFDFGVRAAAREEAKELSFAANTIFSGSHQKLIYDVTTAFYDLWAATRRLDIQRHRAAAAETIAKAARARRNQQLATVTAVSQAEQLVAQARFSLTRAQSEVNAASTRLATVVGLSPRQKLSPTFPSQLRLPRKVPAQLDIFIADALQRRPDLQAAFARARARKAHISAVESSFGPKIVGSAALGHQALTGEIDDSRYGSVSGSNGGPVAGVYVGVSIPIWNGGVKEQRLKAARAEYKAAVADSESLRNLAEGEIVTAYETLKSSLAANKAARQLVTTARTGDNAAEALFHQGIATVTDVSAAQRALYDAQLSEVEAQHAALTSAATLAFASGQVR